jgi:hypothetical protein
MSYSQSEADLIKENAELRRLVKHALTVCEGLAEQQAMADDWWEIDAS